MLVVTTILFVLIVLYWYGIRTFDYWKVKGVKHDRPLPFVGNNLKQFLHKASIGMMANEMYKKYPEEKVVGYYRARIPELVVRDPEIAKRILVTDFNCFYAKGLHPNKTVVEPLLQNLFFADGDVWRLLRQRFTHVFSTAKLKAMFPLITRRAEQLQTITEEITKKDFYDARELMARYTTDFIGECGFGINMDSLSEENNQFRRLGKRIFQRNLRDTICSALKIVFPELAKSITFLDPEFVKNMVQLVRTVLNERGHKPSGRNDFIDLLLEIKEKGNMIGESLDKKKPDGTPEIVEIELDDLLLTAQVFVFFGAGFETSSSASSTTLHHLAYNPDCQVKVQKEIDEILSKYDNKLSYEAIKEMKYLEMCFRESIRMYPSPGYLIRMCVKPEYLIPELNLEIHDGVKMIIPIAAIQNDEKYFSNPQQFDPERFKDGAKQINQFVYMPFGEGPRACVGARLGQMQSMAGIAAVLQKYSVEPAACSKQVPDPDPSAIITEGYADGLPLKFKKRVTS